MRVRRVSETSAPFSGRLPSIETRLWESRLSMCLRSMPPPYWYLPGSTTQFAVAALMVREPPSGCPCTRSEAPKLTEKKVSSSKFRSVSPHPLRAKR